MGFRKSFIILAAICLTCGVCIFALSGYTAIDDDETKQREAEWLAELQQKQVPIVFYGKVLDLDGQPVSDVDISLHIRAIDGFKTIICKTNENGLFTVNSTGEALTIDEISKETYEFVIKKNPARSSFDYSTIGSDYHVPDAENPVVFYLRKRNHPNYINDSDFNFQIEGYSTYERQEHLIFQGYYTSEGKQGLLPNGKIKNYFDSEDYRIQGQLSEDGKHYIITISTLRANSGCIAGDQLLYEAPAEGYTPSVSFPVDISETDDQYKYIYMKTNDGQFYSVITFEFTCLNYDRPDNRYMYVDASIYTNVEGNRGLEYDGLYNLLEGNWRCDLYDLRCCQEVTEREFMERRGLKKLPWKASKFSDEINEEVFMQEMQKEKELRKKEDPHWWHLLE